MAISISLRKLVCCAAPEREETEAPAKPARPEPVHAGPEPAEFGLEPAQAGPAQAGRPYRDYVENETDRYRREMVKPGSLPKPDQQELRAGAFPILGKALRRRQGKVPDPALSQYRAHQAVNVVQSYLVETGRLRHPFTLSEESPDYAEALIQLVAHANWRPRKIPLPAPRHPPIRKPVSAEESWLRGDYAEIWDRKFGTTMNWQFMVVPN